MAPPRPLAGTERRRREPGEDAAASDFGRLWESGRPSERGRDARALMSEDAQRGQRAERRQWTAMGRPAAGRAVAGAVASGLPGPAPWRGDQRWPSARLSGLAYWIEPTRSTRRPFLRGDLFQSQPGAKIGTVNAEMGGAMAKKKTAKSPKYEAFEHREATSPMRPDVGTQAAFKKKKPPVTYRYDSSLSPALDWDGQNPAREQGEAILAELGRQLAEIRISIEDPGLEPTLRDRLAAASANCVSMIDRLKAMSRPFLNWAGKAERLSFDVPTLPLFVHERLSTKGIVKTLGGHRRDHFSQGTMFDLFGDPHHSIADQITRAYEYSDGWVNRMILGDSLVVMNSLVHFENLGRQVQTIYMDPPYGINYGSNFQPFVRGRDVSHGDDDDMTREPEMVQAYRDTWEIGLHSYLSYLRDRFVLVRDLLSSTGSVFVQISDENVHHVRELMDEIFGSENFCSLITFTKTSSATTELLPGTADYLLWYAKHIDRVKYRQIYLMKEVGESGATKYTSVLLKNGETRPMTAPEIQDPSCLPEDSRIFTTGGLTSQRPPGDFPVQFMGRTYRPATGYWKTGEDGMKRLIEADRVVLSGKSLRYVRYFDDFIAFPITNTWTDIGGIQSRADPKIYVVQTANTAIQRCLLMTTDPGDLVLDPTCGSGTTAYVAEQWGRRWITIDTSRVPLALARQRLLTATFPYYQLAEESRGPVGGFVYKRKQNNRGEEVGGIVPHLTLKSIANNEPPAEEVLVDRPEVEPNVTRVTGPFTVEGTIPPPIEMQDTPNSTAEVGTGSDSKFADRMLEVLRKSPVLRLEGNRTVTLKNVRPPAKSLSLSAEAIQNGEENKLVAFVFGPENGAVTETLVHHALREAHMKGYAHLYVVGFAIQPNARKLIADAGAMGVPATYVQATPDLMMGDLLKSLRSSQIFSVCGLPEVEVRPAGDGQFEVELLGLDVFDPVTMEVEHRQSDDVPAWFLDTDYNNLCFHVCQAFFPRTSAWDSLKKALKGIYDDSVWDHLAGTTSTPFEPGEYKQIAVKVVDDRGNELLVVKILGA
ncbi:MAG: site-specific DNA-methyltransferase [Isosphaerales bacterium]